MVDDSVIDFLHIELVDAMPEKLEQVGFTTGIRYVERLTADMLRFHDEELDVMKFICREFWTSIFHKQIDNLRTNRSGQYVLHENRFRFITKISNSKQYLELMPKYLAFTCGLIRGALADFDISATVSGDVTKPPACIFNVQIHRGLACSRYGTATTAAVEQQLPQQLRDTTITTTTTATTTAMS